MTDLVFSPSTLDEPPMVVFSDDGGSFQPGPTTAGGFSLHVDDVGWQLPCVYTVGLTDYGLPELMFFGLDQSALQRHWEVLKHRISELIIPGRKVSSGRFAALVTPVSTVNCGELEEAVRRYGFHGFTAVQLYWVVGQDNARPTVAELRFLARQPYVGHGTLRELLEGY